MIAHPIILCNGVGPSEIPNLTSTSKCIQLNYRDTENRRANIKLALPDFVRHVNYLPPRILDLLEIAAYVFCGDRLVSRGRPDDLEFHAWSRQLHFAIRVRDKNFWDSAKGTLSDALEFMSGDQSYDFTFLGGYTTPATGLFDSEEFQINAAGEPAIALFSGGLDSTAGTLDLLNNTVRPICLVSHRSGLPRTARTQSQLVKTLRENFPTRISPYGFKCNLTADLSRVEETQRTRAFLYTSIAFALASGLSQRRIYVYENGVTAINIAKRADMDNARSSRTVHPKTIFLLSKLFSQISEHGFSIETPYLWRTKTEVFSIMEKCGGPNLISSTISCGKTFSGNPIATHCGGCSQCIDRRISSYSAKLSDLDDVGIYNNDIVNESVSDGAMQTTLGDYIRQAYKFAESTIDSFYSDHLVELADLADFLPGNPREEEAVELVYDLFHRHGEQIFLGMEAIRNKFDNLRREPAPGSLLDIIRHRRYIDTSNITEDKDESTSQHRSQKANRIMNSTNVQPNSHRPIEIFYSYAHEDERLRRKLETHLRLFARERLITGWHDRKITAGKEFEGQIDEHLNQAAIILLLVSADFLDSDYCYDIELERAMERHRAGEARVIPIILRECEWHRAKFGQLVALPTDGRSVTGRRWKNQDEAFADVARGLREVIADITAAQP